MLVGRVTPQQPSMPPVSRRFRIPLRVTESLWQIGDIFAVAQQRKHGDGCVLLRQAIDAPCAGAKCFTVLRMCSYPQLGIASIAPAQKCDQQAPNSISNDALQTRNTFSGVLRDPVALA